MKLGRNFPGRMYFCKQVISKKKTKTRVGLLGIGKKAVSRYVKGQRIEFM